jgi:hypothetical protein
MWRLGRMDDIMPSADGRVRVQVKVKPKYSDNQFSMILEMVIRMKEQLSRIETGDAC